MAMAKHSFSDDEEETLSLCDLPTYSNPADWEDIKKVDRNLSSSSSDDDQEFFEFSSKDFSALNHEAESIIFCGKLIPHREQPAKLEIKTNPKHNSKKISIFGRKLSSSSSSSSISSSYCKSRTSPSPKGHNKVQHIALLASPAKSRWYMYMFGLARFPMEMELRDIKNRQSRHIPKPMFLSQENGGDMVRSGGKGLWGLLRVLGCHHATTMVKSVTCI